MILDPEFWSQLLGNLVSNVLNWLPGLFGALLLLLLGWVVARIVQFTLGGLLSRLGLDRLSERAGIAGLLSDANLDPSLSRLTARLVYWLVLLVFLLAAAESLGMGGIVETLNGLVGYLPSVLAAALILLLGGLIARVIGDGVSALAVQTGVTAGPVLGQGIRYVLLTFAVILALEQLGIETTLLVTAATALIGATALALALAFGIGSRDLARNIMAGFHAKDTFEEGQNLSVGGHSGKLVSIGAVKTVIETNEGLVSIPNFTLVDEHVTVHSQVEAGSEETE
jgi:small-conductance mechanosensitive channel